MADSRLTPRAHDLIAEYLAEPKAFEHTHPTETLKTFYNQICESYRAIDAFRATLLGLLPLASAGGIFLLLGDSLKQTGNEVPFAKPVLIPLGIFGFLITLGLFSYELYGIKKCTALIETGCALERVLKGIGQFNCRPDGVRGYINEPFAAGIIYPSVLGAWIFLTLTYFFQPLVAGIGGFIVLIGFCIPVMLYVRHLKKNAETSPCSQ